MENAQRLYRLDKDVSINETMVPRSLIQTIYKEQASEMGDKTVGLMRGQDWLCLQLPSLPRKRRGSCGA